MDQFLAQNAEKECRKCGQTRPADTQHFIKDPRNASGLGAICRECDRRRMSLHKASEAGRAWRRQNQADNRQHYNAKAAKWQAAHKTEVRQAVLRWAEQNPCKLLLKRARFRSRRKGWPFTLTLADVERLWTPECPVLGLTYDLSLEGPLDLSPSLDRRDPSGAYEPGNIVIMSYRANRLKNNGTAEEHRLIGERLRAGVVPMVRPLSGEELLACHAILLHTKGRSKRRGYEFRMTVHDIPGFPSECPYLGIPLTQNRMRPGDDSRSLDRIDSRFGYVPGNVELISLRANRLKGDGTAEEHLRIADWQKTK